MSRGRNKTSVVVRNTFFLSGSVQKNISLEATLISPSEARLERVQQRIPPNPEDSRGWNTMNTNSNLLPFSPAFFIVHHHDAWTNSSLFFFVPRHSEAWKVQTDDYIEQRHMKARERENVSKGTNTL